jgi:formate C-acetyltransferase
MHKIQSLPFTRDMFSHDHLTEEGLAALRGLLYTYFAKGGVAIHFNIFDAETLKEAQKNPEKYANLQIRVCGWNVRFVELAKSEQDAYIKRAENIAE